MFVQIEDHAAGRTSRPVWVNALLVTSVVIDEYAGGHDVEVWSGGEFIIAARISGASSYAKAVDEAKRIARQLSNVTMQVSLNGMALCAARPRAWR